MKLLMRKMLGLGGGGGKHMEKICIHFKKGYPLKATQTKIYQTYYESNEIDEMY